MESLGQLGSQWHTAHLLLCVGTRLGEMLGSSQLQQLGVTVEPDDELPLNPATLSPGLTEQ